MSARNNDIVNNYERKIYKVVSNRTTQRQDLSSYEYQARCMFYDGMFELLEEFQFKVANNPFADFGPCGIGPLYTVLSFLIKTAAIPVYFATALASIPTQLIKRAIGKARLEDLQALKDAGIYEILTDRVKETNNPYLPNYNKAVKPYDKNEVMEEISQVLENDSKGRGK